ncbi:MAG: enoyl-CoA hydratase-related protein, partial [Verrucomicrobiota bacterium]
MTTLTTHSPQTGSNISEHHGKHRLMHGIHLEMDDRDIAALVFDHPNRSVNVFDEAMLDELDVALDVVESLKPKGVIFLSAKASTFIAGADLGAFVNADEEDLDRLIKKGQELFERIAKLPGITVAAIHGACLGGGLELSLACDYRVSTIDNATRLGLPETLLGIIPAWGGSTRLPRLVGLPTSLRAILTGKSFRSKQALKMGLVDEVVPPTSLRAAAVRLVGGAAPKRKARWATNHPLSAGIIRIVTKRRTLRSSRGHYPALIEAIEVVTRGGYGSVEASLERERRSIMRLASTDVTANLMRLFHLQENAKKFRFDDSTDPQLLKAIH